MHLLMAISLSFSILHQPWRVVVIFPVRDYANKTFEETGIISLWNVSFNNTSLLRE